MTERRRPLLKPWYRIAREEDRIVLEYAQSVVVFEGRAAARLLPSLLPLLDGSRTREDVLNSFDETARPGAGHALATLERHGLVCEGPALAGLAPAERGTAELLASLADGEPRAVRTRLEECRVAVLGASPAADELERVLQESGLADTARLASWSSEPARDLTLVAPCGSELPCLPAWNERALETGRPWLQLLPFDGRAVVVGPAYVPGETGCYECYLRRRASIVDYPDELRLVERLEAPYPTTPALDRLAAGIAALAALRWLTGGDDLLPGFLYLVEADETLGVSGHVLYRVPRCPVCGRVGGATAPPLPWHDAVVHAR